MNKILLAALVAFCTNASATVLSFDDIPAGLSPVPDGYGGFNWNNAAEVDVFSQADIDSGDVSADFAKGIHSGDQAVFNAAGDSPVVVSLVDPNATFNFNGAYFTASTGSETLNFVGLLGGNVVYTTGDYTINSSGPQLITPIGYEAAGIDTLEIFSSVPGSNDNAPPFILDDFSYNGGAGNNGGNPVPEPFSLSLMGLGLVALGATRRRKA